MKIIDLDDQRVPLYLVCLEDWSDEMKETGNRKAEWYEKMKDKGLRVKLALDDNGTVGGMIQYVPIEYSFAEGANLYFINCVWVHGYKQGRGDFRHRGMGRALLEAAELDAKGLGAKGIVAWGLLIPVFMRASWFKRHGYHRVDRMGMQVLLWKRFTADAVSPKWIRPKEKPPLEAGKVTVTTLCNGWCPGQNLVLERCRRAVADPRFAGKVVLRELDTFDRSTFLHYGISDALFINHKQIRTGPPPSFSRIQKLINKAAHKLS